MVKNLFIPLALILMLTSCTHRKWIITYSNSTKIAIDSTTEKLADKEYELYLQPVKQKIDAEMNLVIGVAVETMKGHAPESLLSNFSTDVYREAATEFSGEKVDISMVNLGGLRTTVPAGNITVRKVFELMPFENELVIVWIKSYKLLELL